MMKQVQPRITFMITPAEMIAIRCQTVLFLNERGSCRPRRRLGPLADHLDVAAQREPAIL